MTEKTAEILKPFGDYFTPGPSRDVIEALEECLASAKRGEIVAIAIATLNCQGSTATFTERGNRGFAELLGAVSMMEDDIKKKWRELCG
jgi:hypothetical protein